MGRADATCVEQAVSQGVALATLDVDLGGPVNLATTLGCGQAFRWRPAAFPGRLDLPFSYRGVIPEGGLASPRLQHASGPEEPFARAGQLAVLVGQRASSTRRISVAYDPRYAGSPSVASVQRRTLGYDPQYAGLPGERWSSEPIADAVRRYFSSQDDIAAIEAEVARLDPPISAAVEEGHGLRILQQDHWECLASYVLSINNSIPNISRIIEHFSARLGDPVGLGLHGFPPPERIACQESAFLRQSKCGFRDRYLKDAAERVVSGEIDLAGFERVPTEEARERLMTIQGVGPKVADCVLLFGYHRLEVFPADVWITRAISRFYLHGRAITPEFARQEGMRRFGPLAGYAQEYLFLRIREDSAPRQPPRRTAR